MNFPFLQFVYTIRTVIIGKQIFTFLLQALKCYGFPELLMIKIALFFVCFMICSLFVCLFVCLLACMLDIMRLLVPCFCFYDLLLHFLCFCVSKFLVEFYTFQILSIVRIYVICFLSFYIFYTCFFNIYSFIYIQYLS